MEDRTGAEIVMENTNIAATAENRILLWPTEENDLDPPRNLESEPQNLSACSWKVDYICEGGES
jgi:hypothetical protein